MAAGISKVTRLDWSTKLIKTAAKGLGVAYNLRGIVATKLLHLANGYQQGRQCMQVVVAGGAGEDAAIGGRPVFLLGLGIHVAQDYAPLRSWKGFMRAAGHPR